MSSSSISILSIATDPAHWRHPLTLSAGQTRPKAQRSLIMKVALVALAILASLATASILPVFYFATAIWKKCHPIRSSQPNVIVPHMGSLSPSHSFKTASGNNVALSITSNQAEGIKMGLPNLGNTCWLNSMLKFFAATSYYDELFKVNVDQITPRPSEEQIGELKDLQKNLKTVITTLRSGEKGSVLDMTLYKKLAVSVVNVMFDLYATEEQGNKNFLTDGEKVALAAGKQLDAPEFLLRLQSIFGWPSDEVLEKTKETEETKKRYVQFMGHYRNLGNLPVVKNPNLENFRPLVEVTIPPDKLAKPSIHVVNLIAEPQSLEVRPDIALAEGQSLSANVKFQYEPHMVNAPETLTFYIKRKVWLDDNGTGVTKCDKPIKFDDNGCLELLEYDEKSVVLNSSDNGTVCKRAKAVCTYQIEAAVRHLGSAEGGGHYVCYERTQDGTIIKHNDSIVGVAAEGMGGFEQADLLRLRLIRREIFSQSITTKAGKPTALAMG